MLWLSLVALLCIIGYRFRKRIIAMPIWQKLSKLSDFDLEEIITKKWQAISPISKKSFLWIFLITNIVFLFHTVQYMWGNHDWGLIKSGISISQDLWAGRFTSGLVQQFLGGDLLPVINNIFCFTGFTFAMIYLAKYWKVPQTPLNYTLFGLFIILMPYTLSWLWYIKQTSLYWNVFFVIYALYISQRKTYTSSVIAIILMVISLGAYASIISTIAIVLLGRIWLDIIIEQKSIKEVFHTYLRTSINILISVIIFKLILIYYDYAGKLRNGTPNTEYITFSELPEKIKLVLRSIKEIFYIQLPFIELPWKILVSIPLIYITYLIVKMQKKEKLCALGVLVIILLSSQITNFMAKADFSHKARIDFFSLPYIFTIFIVCCLRGKKGIKSIILILMCCSIWLCVLSAMRFQKAFYLGRQAEMQVYTDIISRIKQDKQFDIKRKYRMFSTSAKGMRKYFYRQQNQKWDEALLGDALIPHWDGKPVYNFYEAESYLSSYANIERKESIAHLSPFEIKHIADFVLNKAEPYPHKNSVYVDDKYIIVIYDEKGLNNAKRHIQARLKELENKHE